MTATTPSARSAPSAARPHARPRAGRAAAPRVARARSAAAQARVRCRWSRSFSGMYRSGCRAQIALFVVGRPVHPLVVPALGDASPPEPARVGEALLVDRLRVRDLEALALQGGRHELRREPPD